MSVEDSSTEVLRAKILKTLRIYKELSPSMLHTGIGPAIPAAVWRPILAQLIREGLIVQTIKQDNNRDYSILRLAEANLSTPQTTQPTLKTV